MGEESAEIGDDALRRVGPAANGEATQFREQGGGLRATARGAGVGLVGRHVRSVGIGLVLVLVLLLVPAPGFRSLFLLLVTQNPARVIM